MIIYGVLILIGIILLKMILKRNSEFPKLIWYVLIIGTILSFLLFGLYFANNHILDISHPVYSNGGLSTLSWLTSLGGGIVLSIPFNIYWLIDDATYEKQRERIEKKRKEKA